MAQLRLSTLSFFTVLAGVGCGQKELSVTVFAAASTSGAIEQILADYPQGTRVHAAGSAALARQIDAGIAVDLFVSADERYLAGRPGTRSVLIGNQLVEVSNPVGGPCVVMGDPEIAPVGAYAKRHLQAIGQWKEVSERVRFVADAPAVVRTVETGLCARGFAYLTDTKARPVQSGKALGEPVWYHALALTERGDEVLSYLQSDGAGVVFEEAGFGVR